MKQPSLSDAVYLRVRRICLLILAFLALTVGGYFLLYRYTPTGGTWLSQTVYSVGTAALLAGMLTLCASFRNTDAAPARGVWYCPAVAGILALLVVSLAYSCLGVWPLGNESVMMVDLHHQYGPLLSEWRYLLSHFGNLTYSFHIGLGANLIPTTAYYMASPFNLLLLLFPERYLTEGILVITLLKDALAAAGFAACAQYLYRRRDARVIALSVMYSMMMYMLAYSWNVMWLDVVALLPLVILAMEHMLRSGRILPYILLLALALLANYYIGFMLCVFLVLYFAVWLIRQPRPAADNARGVLQFAAGSLLAGGLAAMILIPTALALGRTSAAGENLPAFKTEFNFLDLLGRFFCGVSPTIRSGNLPNIYCGIPAVLLLPIYVSCKQIPLRRRLSYTALLGFLLMSCHVNVLDLLWHGLHSPNDLPYRFSFLISFVALLMAGRALACDRHITAAQIGGSLAGCAAYLFLCEQIGGDHAPDPAALYVNLALLAVYAGVLLFRSRGKLPVRAGRMLLLTVVTAEMLIGGGQTFLDMNGSEYYTDHEDYLDNDGAAADDAAIRRAEEIAAEAGEVFCRIEYLPRSTCMDTALHHYRGITTFASSNPYDTTLFMGNLGYAINGVNSYLYNSFVPSCDSLLGVRYVILDFSLSSHPQLEQVDSLRVGSENRYIYRNRLALPAAYAASDELRQFAGSAYDPFANQERLYTALTGDSRDIFTLLPLETSSYRSTVNGSSFTKPSGDDAGDFAAVVDQKGQYFAYVDCRAADDIRLTCYKEDGTNENSWSVTNYEPYIIDLGTLSPGHRVEATLSGDGTLSGNVYVARLETATLEEKLATLAKGGMTITEATATRLAGTVTAAEDGVLLVTVPYDKGWSAVVDGTAAETLPIDRENTTDDGALLGVVLPAGSHTVTLTYRAPGQWLGIAVSGVSAVLILLLALWQRRRKDGADSGNSADGESPADTADTAAAAPTDADAVTVLAADTEADADEKNPSAPAEAPTAPPAPITPANAPAEPAKTE